MFMEVKKLLSKDQVIGGIIFAASLILGILYALGLFYFGNPFSGWTIGFWLIAIPVFLAFIAIIFIGAWIGWTMFTTPPPKPIEEIISKTEEKEMEQKEKKEE
jgi:hypothetical protein